MRPYSIAVVVPNLNDLEALKSNLDYWLMLEHAVAELIFVDGGSTDGSYEWLKKYFYRVVKSPSGRAVQMNKGAEYACSTTLVFLHADTRLPLDFAKSLNKRQFLWGFFELQLAPDSTLLKIVAWSINFRSRLFKVATGDQCLFFDRTQFLAEGGYKEIPLMEDIEISRRFNQHAAPFIIPQKAVSSSRRWLKNGTLRTIVFMWYIQVLYKMGVDPKTLAKKYYGKS